MACGKNYSHESETPTLLMVTTNHFSGAGTAFGWVHVSKQ